MAEQAERLYAVSQTFKNLVDDNPVQSKERVFQEIVGAPEIKKYVDLIRPYLTFVTLSIEHIELTNDDKRICAQNYIKNIDNDLYYRLRDIIAAANYWDIPTLLDEGIRSLATYYNSKEQVVLYNADPESYVQKIKNDSLPVELEQELVKALLKPYKTIIT